MINRITIKNFQSLKNVDIELGKLTVIVGDSNSGKSAFVRAFKAVSSNCRGNSFVTRGQSRASITLSTDLAKITLEKGESVGCYKICGPFEKIFTKIGSSVPEEVTKTLKIDPVSTNSVNFAGQHDMPYLLTDTGSTVARELGDLTNVSKLFEAVREGNRQKLQHSGNLKSLNQTLKILTDKIETFKDLFNKKEAASQAEILIVDAKKIQTEIIKLQNSLEVVYFFERSYNSILDTDEISMEPIQKAHTDLEIFKHLLKQLSYAQISIKTSISKIEEQDRHIKVLETELHERLIESGECPTCHQRVN